MARNIRCNKAATQSVSSSLRSPRSNYRFVGQSTLAEYYHFESNNVVVQTLAVSLDKPLGWAVGFFFGTVELGLELWTVIAGISRFDD